MPHSIERTGDGSQTLLHPLLGDAYHSLNGAVTESLHVFIDAGLRYYVADRNADPAAPGTDTPVRILEVGFGTGLNALLSAQTGIPVHYTGLELYPVPRETWQALDYAADPLFGRLHETLWDTPAAITPWFTLHKRQADLVGTQFETTFDVVYMDAFAPTTQPELWTPEMFAKLYAATAPGGVLVTYCAKGEVKRALRAAGYSLRRLPGAPGKRHMLRATKE